MSLNFVLGNTGQGNELLFYTKILQMLGSKLINVEVTCVAYTLKEDK